MSQTLKQGTVPVEKESQAMADRKYEIDDQGNLVQDGEPAAESGAGADRPVTEADRRKFLNALLASDVIGVLVLAGGGLLLPESRTLLLILAAVYAVAAVPVYVWLSRSTQQKVEASRQRQISG